MSARDKTAMTVFTVSNGFICFGILHKSTPLCRSIFGLFVLRNLFVPCKSATFSVARLCEKDLLLSLGSLFHNTVAIISTFSVMPSGICRNMIY